MVWWYLIIFVVLLIIAVSMVPKPQTVRPAGLGDIILPTAEEGREIPVLQGTRDCYGPNVTGMWGLRTMPVKRSQGK